MILIADSGSTKTEWGVILKSGAVSPERLFTRGLNPFFLSPEEIAREVTETLLTHLPSEPVEKVWFYGAGVRKEKEPVIREALRKVFDAEIFATSDMLGAARALTGDKPGIVCILGTGANSCLYDGNNIVRNVPPLGYLLGDEGSGAWMGKHFLADLLKGLLPKEVEADFRTEYPDLTETEIIRRVYSEPAPNRFLASFAPFISERVYRHHQLLSLVTKGFSEFILRNVALYPEARDLPVSFAGSVAYHLSDILEVCLGEEGFRVGRILKSPMDGLIEYHSQRNV